MRCRHSVNNGHPRARRRRSLRRAGARREHFDQCCVWPGIKPDVEHIRRAGDSTGPTILFRLDIDHIILVIKLAHLTQELLKLPTAILTHFALKLSKRFIYRLLASECLTSASSRITRDSMT
jgi:hypothetical protein